MSAASSAPLSPFTHGAGGGGGGSGGGRGGSGGGGGRSGGSLGGGGGGLGGGGENTTLGQKGGSGGGQNKVKQDAQNAQRLADKIAKKAQLKSEGKLKEKNKGSKAPQKGSGGAVMVNPHTGKKDAAWTAKHGKKK